MYVYIKSEPQLWTVGFYDPKGKWQAESPPDAAARVAWLNGSRDDDESIATTIERNANAKLYQR